jgi:RING finger/CHY zinc finger protein 1
MIKRCLFNARSHDNVRVSAVRCSTCKANWNCRVCHDAAHGDDHTLDASCVEALQCPARTCGAWNAAASLESAPTCVACGVRWSDGYYVCRRCRLIAHKSAPVFHCEQCDLCLVGRRADYYHCRKCRFCIQSKYYNSHKCFGTECPICLDVCLLCCVVCVREMFTHDS